MSRGRTQEEAIDRRSKSATRREGVCSHLDKGRSEAGEEAAELSACGGVQKLCGGGGAEETRVGGCVRGDEEREGRRHGVRRVGVAPWRAPWFGARSRFAARKAPARDMAGQAGAEFDA